MIEDRNIRWQSMITQLTNIRASKLAWRRYWRELAMN